MPQNSQFDSAEGTPGITCSEFDALLSDALDGILSGASQRRFDVHRQRCATCGPLFRETSAGMTWLTSLEEVEPPTNLVHNILAATTMQSKAASASAPKLGWKGRISEMLSDIAQPLRALVREPRLLMTAAMAVFSVTLSLNLVGVKVSDLKHIDLRPSAMREAATIRYTEASNRVIQYYYSIRLVYEVESRLQELKRATSAEEEPRQQQSQPPRDKTENNKKDHERKQNYYSMERQNGLLASGSPNTLNPSSIQQTEQPALEFAVARNIAQNKNCMSLEPSHGFEQDKSIRGLLA